MDQRRLKPKIGDLLAVLLVVAAAISLGAWLLSRTEPGGAAVAVVYRDGQVVRTIDLAAVDGAQTFAVDGDFHNEITVEPGRIRISESDCPGGDCVRSGWISAAGRSLVCLPNRVEIRVQGGDGDVDGVAR